MRQRGRKGPLSGLTSDTDMDTLGVHLVGLDHHLAGVLASIHLLHVGQLQRAVVLERSLPVVKGQ